MSTKNGIYFDDATRTYLYEEALPPPGKSDSSKSTEALSQRGQRD